MTVGRARGEWRKQKPRIRKRKKKKKKKITPENPLSFPYPFCGGGDANSGGKGGQNKSCQKKKPAIKKEEQQKGPCPEQEAPTLLFQPNIGRNKKGTTRDPQISTFDGTTG